MTSEVFYFIAKCYPLATICAIPIRGVVHADFRPGFIISLLTALPSKHIVGQ
jgi:hypothetical protein